MGKVWPHLLVLWLPLAVIAAPPARPQLDGGQSVVHSKFVLIDNRIFVPVFLNGHGPYQFVLDSGGGDGISVTPEVSQQLGLLGQDAHRVTGAGASSEPATRAVIDEARFRGVHLHHLPVDIFSLQPIQAAMGFRRFDGVIGQGVLKALVTTIDYERQTLTVAQPSAWQPRGTRLPIRFRDVNPTVELSLGGLPGTYLLDTGDRSSLSFNGPFAAAHGLLSRYHGRIHTTTGWGIGGPIPGWVFRIPDVALGTVQVHDVVARIPTLKSGFFAGTHYAGSIGDGILKRFRVTLDYPDEAMYLEPRQHALPDPWDRCGVWLAQDPTGFRVLDVVAGSPAAQAHLQVGDVVVKVDGRDAAEWLLPDVRDMLKQPQRVKVQFTIERNHQQLEVPMVLRDLL